jgi:hypothetical protein
MHLECHRRVKRREGEHNIRTEDVLAKINEVGEG